MNGPKLLDRAMQNLAEPNLEARRRLELEAIVNEHKIGNLTTPNPYPARPA